MSQAKRGTDLKTVVATVIAMVPGFLFPFLLTLRVSPQDSDSLILALSIMTTLVSVMGSSIELNTVSEFGRQLTDSSRPGPEAMRSYIRRIQFFGFAAVAVIGVVLTTVYSLSMSNWTPSFLALCAVMLIAPIAAIYSSLNSGIMIGAGNAVAPIASQALRPALPIVLLLVVPDANLVFFAIGFGLGEIGRWIFLSHLRRRKLEARSPVGADALETRGMIWQATSASVSQGAPAVDRIFLNGAPAGFISAYELTDKIYFAAIQFLNYGFLIRRVGRWSRIPKMTRVQGRGILRRDLIFLVSVASALSLLSMLMLYAASFFPIPDIWRTSSGWAMILMLTAPLTVWSSSASRLLIIARKQRYLLWFSVLTITVNLALDIILFSYCGAFGIILATAGTRLLSAIMYALVLRKVVPQIYRSSDPGED